MSRFRTVVLAGVSVFAYVLLEGCISDLGSMKDGDDPDDSNGTVAAYLPEPIAGATYTWRIRTSVSGFAADSSDCTETVAGPITSDGNDVYSLNRSCDTNPERFFIKENGIYFLAEKERFGGLIIGTSDQREPFGNFYRWFDFSFSAKAPDIVLDGGTKTDDQYVNYQVTSMYRGTETVRNSLGDFPDCHRFELVYTVKYTPRVQGDVQTFTRTESRWFAPNTGPIKMVADEYAGNLRVRHTEEELIGFSRP